MSTKFSLSPSNPPQYHAHQLLFYKTQLLIEKYPIFAKFTQSPHPADSSLTLGIAPVSHGIAPLTLGIASVSHGIAPLTHGIACVSHGIAPLTHGIACVKLGIAPLTHGIARVERGILRDSDVITSLTAAMTVASLAIQLVNTATVSCFSALRLNNLRVLRVSA